MTEAVRRLPVGAEVQPGGGVHFRVWAPRRKSVDVQVAGARFSLQSEPDGYFSGHVKEAAPGSTYRFRLDGEADVADPASRFQPEGPHGASEVIDPAAFRWTDAGWRGVSLAGQVIYEMHVGTFTEPGTFAAARARLPALVELGVTVLELMPIADFPGRFGWGYDGVCLFAPTRLYGRPDDLRRLVDDAHACGLAVILDVVYNHLGPDGNYLAQFADSYFTDRYETDWGEPLNFDGPGSGPVRELFIANAGYWIDEFHLDGLRLDATQNLYDESPEHIVAAVARRVREAAGGRQTLVVAENEPQDVRLIQRPESGGYGLDGLWNDDFHHSLQVALTGRREAYYSDYQGSPQEFVSAVKHGFLFQGQRYTWQKQRRGTSTFGLPRAAFVAFVQNHDQVANSPSGARMHEMASPGALRAVLALVLLGPGTPMLFQGQEFAASAPFQYFADHHAELAAKVREGRHQFLSQFPSLKGAEWKERLPDPAAPDTFLQCKLDHDEALRGRHAEMLRLHRDLLAWRRTDVVFQRQGEDGLDGAVLAPAALVLRFYGQDGDDRLLFLNLGADLHLAPAPEPLLAPPPGRSFELAWSSESVEYGGAGTPPVETDDGWHIPGQAAVVLRAGEQRHEARTRFPPPRPRRSSEGEV